MAVVETLPAGLRAADRGATAIRLRPPAGTAGADLYRAALTLVREQPLPVLVSRRADVAAASGAAGVHLPEDDLPPGEVRRLVGEGLVGRSVHDLEGALAAVAAGVDYLFLGPVWATPSHPDAAPLGLEGLAAVARRVPVPVVAIGGLGPARAEAVRAAGAAGWAAVRAFA